MTKLLPVRHPNLDLFVADMLDVMPKSDINSMEHPIFSLSKTPDHTPRHYEHNGNTLSVLPGGMGLATIWDKDILIYCISQLIAGINEKKQPAQKVQVIAHDLLLATNRRIDGRSYQRLDDAFARLRSTTLKTNIDTTRVERLGFGLIDSWRIVESSDLRTSPVEIKLSDWLYRAVLDADVLTLDPGYFRLPSGLGRALYNLARKHCGNQSTWRVNLDTLHTKTGSRSPLKKFRFQIATLCDHNNIPGYHLSFDRPTDQLTVQTKKSCSTMA